VQEPKMLEPAVEDWYNYVETNARLRSDIESMPPQRRTIFKMSRYENLSNMEIAIRLNLSVRTVEKHIELALKDLRRSMS
jgi:RNA polymerase sigma-70 factor (ECF subfamily)